MDSKRSGKKKNAQILIHRKIYITWLYFYIIQFHYKIRKMKVYLYYVCFESI